MDFHKAGQTRCDLFFVWIVTKMFPSRPLLMIWSIRLLEIVARHLTTRSLESDRGACATRTNDQQLVTLFAHVEQSRTFACASMAPGRPFRIASKGPKRADHAAGTDFTRPRHGSCQLSLIEILKCNASLAAAATETIPVIPGEFRRRQTEDEDSRGSF